MKRRRRIPPPLGNHCVFCGGEGDRTMWTQTTGRILVCTPCRVSRFPSPPALLS